MSKKITDKLTKLQKQKDRLQDKMDVLIAEDKEVDKEIQRLQKLQKKQLDLIEAQKKLDLEISRGGN